MTGTRDATDQAPDEIGVGVVGFGWMGRVHAQSYVRVPHHFPDLAPARLVAVADPEAERTADAARRFGFTRQEAAWRSLLDDRHVQAVSVTAPNALHREVCVAMAEAGKHLWVEKPVGLGADDARAVAAAVARAGVQCAVGFNYRNAPAVEHARELLQQGAVGRVTNARFRFFSDYAAHPSGALSWRFERAGGGSGVLGDLASHGVDLVRFLVGDIKRLVADTAVYIPQRPLAAGTQSHFSRGAGEALGEVENEDYLVCLLRGTEGERVVLEASRVAVGEQCTYGFEVHGTEGALSWDFRRMGELQVTSGGGYQDVGTTTVHVGPSHGELAAFQPGAGIAMGFDDLKVVEAARFLRSVALGKPQGASIDDAVRTAEVLEAIAASARSGSWVELSR